MKFEKSTKIDLIKYIPNLVGKSEEEYNTLNKILRDINDIERDEFNKHPLHYSCEGLQKAEELYREVIKFFSKITPKDEKVKEIKDYALTPLEEHKKANEMMGCINYTRFDQARKLEEQLWDVVTSRVLSILNEQFSYVKRDHTGIVYHDPHSSGYLRVMSSGTFYGPNGKYWKKVLRIEATKEIDLERSVSKIEEQFS